MKANSICKTIWPDYKGLAHVSIYRGASKLTSLPFINNYISIAKPVVNYLIAQSGILPSNLNCIISLHVLVKLKYAYKKLQLLLNLGYIFVSYSLTNDFRTINIHVLKKQVVDTINLFFKHKLYYKLNLKFLAQCVLKEKIQEDTHNSIKDAITTLKLQRKY